MLVAGAPAPARAEALRLATWAGDFSRKGPGLLLRDLSRDPPLAAFDTIAEAAPDVLVLTDFDFDAGAVTLGAVAEALAARGLDYPHLFVARPNTGMPTGRDLDGDGYLGGPRDAQGYGWFSGQGGQAILSRHPLRMAADHSAVLWKDVPDSAIGADDPAPDIQRLASTAFWAIAVDAPTGALTLLTVGATPPVFDGPEDRNGRRNRDEVLFWTHILTGPEAPSGPVALIGNLNLDPVAGEGWHDAVRAVLDHPRLQDPQPGAVTATWDSTGPMRVSYVLPDVALRVVAQGVTPPAEDAGPHGLVWVDVVRP
ncbi:endonuclease/exonuclease/phosphatase family protein [Citreimonas salinaria]|uniref:Endonuclease/Exonuclease/phosphatase family protein n=1 Tax=Citreimonas salinaria TaxID=321339 RepID=A0A1H3F5B7_9RHOB|nr:endonuclease/exonuclease/phosphatase family protein [Citreimonas salinaria]SDX86213.1 Endonuclease/Exonuclease/phosphatase family protein [Citreimonas salinaria]